MTHSTGPGTRLAAGRRLGESLRSHAGSFWVRAFVSVGMLALVATQIDFDVLGRRLSDGHRGTYAAAIAAMVAWMLVAAVRWRIFLERVGINVSIARAVRAYWLGAFTTTFLPSQFGGDVTRVITVSPRGERTRGLATVLIDRLSSMGCLVLVGWTAILASGGSTPSELVVALASLTAAGIVAAFLAAWLLRHRGRVGTRLHKRILGPTRQLVDALSLCLSRGALLQATVLGFAYEALMLLALWLVGRAIGVDVSYDVLAAAMPLVLLLSALPVSIAGFGVREGAFILLLRPAGIETTDAAVLSVLFALAFTLASLPGALGLLVGRRSDRRPPEPLTPGGGGPASRAGKT